MPAGLETISSPWTLKGVLILPLPVHYCALLGRSLDLSGQLFTPHKQGQYFLMWFLEGVRIHKASVNLDHMLF